VMHGRRIRSLKTPSRAHDRGAHRHSLFLENARKVFPIPPVAGSEVAIYDLRDSLSPDMGAGLGFLSRARSFRISSLISTPSWFL